VSVRRQRLNHVAAAIHSAYPFRPYSPPKIDRLSSDNFGLLIAYLLPGFVTLWALRPFVPAIEVWLGASTNNGPTVDGFLYATLGSTAAGLLISAIRWAVIDHLYHVTGIPEPKWDFRRLPEALAAFESHVEDHYRYYQHYANLLVAITFAYSAELFTVGHLPVRCSGFCGQSSCLFLR
jgi:hypothetical protein